MPYYKEAADEAERLAPSRDVESDKVTAIFAATPVVISRAADPYDRPVTQQWVCWECADRGLVRRFVKNHVAGSSLATIRGLDAPFFLGGTLRDLYRWVEQHPHKGIARVD